MQLQRRDAATQRYRIAFAPWRAGENKTAEYQEPEITLLLYSAVLFSLAWAATRPTKAMR